MPRWGCYSATRMAGPADPRGRGHASGELLLGSAFTPGGKYASHFQCPDNWWTASASGVGEEPVDVLRLERLRRRRLGAGDCGNEGRSHERVGRNSPEDRGATFTAFRGERAAQLGVEKGAQAEPAHALAAL